jgi:hypothetical protein
MSKTGKQKTTAVLAQIGAMVVNYGEPKETLSAPCCGEESVCKCSMRCPAKTKRIIMDIMAMFRKRLAHMQAITN